MRAVNRRQYNLISIKSHMKKLALLVLLCVSAEVLPAGRSHSVAVASNLSHALTDIAASFREDYGINMKLTFGSSGNFARQIIQGAPFRVFLSADRKSVDLLLDNGLHLLADIDYADGRIGLFVPHASGLSGHSDLESVIKGLFHGRYSRLVIPNPEHAPYGLAAQQALQNAGVWIMDRQRLILAENAAQAAQIAMSGNVDAGFIPASFARLPQLAAEGRFFLVPAHWHQALSQQLVLLAGASDAEKRFFDYLQGDKALRIIKAYGYDPKPSTSPDTGNGLASP